MRRGGLQREEERLRQSMRELNEEERFHQRGRVPEPVEEAPRENENPNDVYQVYGAVVSARHGQAPSNKHGVTIGDNVTEESLNNLYRVGKKDLTAIIKDSGIVVRNANDIGGRHSKGIKRTRMTIHAMASGLLSGIEGRGEQNYTQGSERSGVKFEEDSRIGYNEGGVTIHEELFKNEKDGANQVLNHWLQNPLLDKHHHQKYGEAKIEPFVNVYGRTKQALQDALMDVRSGNHKVFLIGSHGGLQEPAVLSMLYAAGVRGITSVEQIGGPIQKEEYFTVLVRYNKATGRDEGVLNFRGRAFAFDLENFMDNRKDPYIAEVTGRLHSGEFNRDRQGKQNYIRQPGKEEQQQYEREMTKDELNRETELRDYNAEDVRSQRLERKYDDSNRMNIPQGETPGQGYRKIRPQEKRVAERKYMHQQEK